MTIADWLGPDSVLIGLRVSEKRALLDLLAHRAARALGLAPDQLRAALLRRECLGSTGIGEGIALPHARLEVIDRPFGLFARLRDPLDFEAIDEKPVDLVFLLLLPLDTQDEPSNALACVARRLRDRETALALRAAHTAPAVHGLLTR